MSALAEYSVLREIHSRHEGPYSVSYLADLHDCLRCMGHLQMWADSLPLGRELYRKYTHTHGPAEDSTVDAAKRYAWALVETDMPDQAVDVYLTTADALWSADQTEEATPLLGAAVVHHYQSTHEHVIDMTRLANGDELAILAATLPDVAQVTMDGLVTLSGQPG